MQPVAVGTWMHEKPNVQSAPLRGDSGPCLPLLLLLHGSHNDAFPRTIAPTFPTKLCCTPARCTTGRWGCALKNQKRLKRVPVPHGRSYCVCVGATQLRKWGCAHTPLKHGCRILRNYSSIILHTRGFERSEYFTSIFEKYS